jgi:hypothetical protein
MNPRERILAIAVVSLVLVAGLGMMFYQFYLSPYRAKKANLDQLTKQGDTKEARIKEIAGQRAQLERYRQQSLPADINAAKREYQRYLDDLLRKSGFSQVSLGPRNVTTRNVPTLANKAPVYTPIGYTVSGRATLDSLVKMMEDFYRTALLHQIKTLSVTRPRTAPQQGQRRDELDITLQVDALVVAGADKRTTLMPAIDRRLVAADALAVMSSGPTGLGAVLWTAGPFGPHGPGVLADPERDYRAMSAKNIFFGPRGAVATPKPNETPLEQLRYTILTAITTDYAKGGRREASLYDQSSQAPDQRTRLRTTGGWNEINLLRTNQGITLVHGEVLRIDDRSLVFRVALNAREPEDKAPYYPDHERIYSLHKNDLDALVREGSVRTDDASRVFWIDKGRWDFLIADKMVTVNGRAFAFQWDLVKGFVLHDDGNAVIIRIDDKYCAYRYGSGGRPVQPHEGYCTLPVGGNLADALHTPLKEAEIKTLLASH